MRPRTVIMWGYIGAAALGTIAVGLPNWMTHIKGVPNVCKSVDLVSAQGLWWKREYIQLQKNESDNSYTSSSRISNSGSKAVISMMIIGLIFLVVNLLCTWYTRCMYSDDKELRISRYFNWTGVTGGLFIVTGVIVFSTCVVTDSDILTAGFWIATVSGGVACLTAFRDLWKSWSPCSLTV